MRVKLKSKAEEELSKLSKKDQERILAALVVVSENPFAGKKLEGEFKSYRSLRVWPYRIIYTIYQKERLILVIRIGQRQGVYK